MVIIDNAMTTQQKVCYLSAAPRVSTKPEAELGGPRSHILGTIQGFKLNGWHVDSFIMGDKVPLNWIQQGSEQAIRKSSFRTLGADILRLSMRTGLPQWVRRDLSGDYDLAYERYAAFQSLGQAFQKRNIPWVLETNAPLFYESKIERSTIKLNELARRVELEAYRKCDWLVCVSETLKSILIQEASIPASKVIVVPNGVDTLFFRPESYTPRRLFDGFTVGYIGTLIDWQGLDLLLEVTRELADTGIVIHLTFVGDGLARQDLQETASRLQLNDQVRFVGYVARDQVPHYVAGFDCGFSGQLRLKIGEMYLSPLKLYEYMAMAKPVVASRFDDAVRAIVDNESGFLFTAGNKPALRDALMRALDAYNSVDMLAQIGMSARKSVIAYHSWDARVAHLLRQIHLS